MGFPLLSGVIPQSLGSYVVYFLLPHILRFFLGFKKAQFKDTFTQKRTALNISIYFLTAFVFIKNILKCCGFDQSCCLIICKRIEFQAIGVQVSWYEMIWKRYESIGIFSRIAQTSSIKEANKI